MKKKVKIGIAILIGFSIYELGRAKGIYDVNKNITKKMDSYVSGYLYIDEQLEGSQPDVYLDLSKYPNELDNYAVFRVKKVKNKNSIK